MKRRYRIVVNEFKRAWGLQHLCKLFIDDRSEKSRRAVLSFDFPNNETFHNNIIDLKKVCDGKLSESVALLYINHPYDEISMLARRILDIEI